MNTFRFVHLTGFLAVIIGIFLISAPSEVVYAAGTDQCESGITSPFTTPAGYAAPFSNLTEGEILVDIEGCDDGEVLVKAGNGSDDTFVYQYGYAWDGADWKRFSFDAHTQGKSTWLVGSAMATLPETNNWVVAYICERDGSAWDCSDKQWKLQKVAHDADKKIVSDITSGESIDLTEDDDEQVVDTERAAQTTDDQWLVGYYQTEDWGTLETFDLPWQHLTHLALGDMKIAPWGSIDVHFDIPNADIRGLYPDDELFDAIADANTNGVTPLLMIGGGEPMTDVWRERFTEEKIYETIYSLIWEFDNYGFEGMAINWTDLTDEDLEQIKFFIEVIKEEKPDFVVTMAVPYVALGEEPNERYIEIEPLVDRLTIMQHEDAEDKLARNTTSHYSALVGATLEAPFSLESSVAAYNEAGVPLRKLNIETPYHGQCWENVDGIGEEITSSTEITGLLSLWDIFNEYVTNKTQKWDDEAKVEYIEITNEDDERDCTFISYVDREGAQERAAWVRDQGLGGITAWNLAQEDLGSNGATGYLTEAIARELKK